MTEKQMKRFIAQARSESNKKRLDWLIANEHLWNKSAYEIALTMRELGLYAKRTNYKDAAYAISRQIEYLKKLRDSEEQELPGEKNE